MRKVLVAIAAFAVIAIPAASLAQEDAAPPAEEAAAAPAEESTASHAEEGAAEKGLHLKLGLGVGYGIPMGDAEKDEKLSDLYSAEIPIELEASYKFTHAISAGLYVGYGLGLVSSNELDGGCVTGPCPKASDVYDSIASWRFGVQGEYEFGKVGPALPFAALRVGYVTETITMKDGGGTEKVNGWEYLTLIGGADFEVAHGFAVGPFVSLALGQYTTAKAEGAESESIPSAERAMHEWLTIGVRGAFTL
jgi:hypothetical protein